MSSFTDLGVPARLSDIIAKSGIVTPTPIQQATLPDSLRGRDVLGRGRTGSGKSLAFLLPMVTRLSESGRTRPNAPRGLILAPTRELVAQIHAVLTPLAAAAGLTAHTVFGGVSQGAQVTAFRRGTDIVVACPGRLEDLIKQGHASLADVQITVLDEADHMADLGFLPAVKRLLGRTPAGGQRMLFSATLDQAVNGLVRQFLTDPAVHEADSPGSTVSTMSHHLLHVERENRLPVLIGLTGAPERTVVFTRTKRGAKVLAAQLTRSGVTAVELHGNLSQNARTRNLDDFHSGHARVMVATDIAARGIHVDDVALVVHADPPADHKAYLHRSGRTARAGNVGTVITLMTTDQVGEVKLLTRAAGINAVITRVNSADHPILATLAGNSRTGAAGSTGERSALQPMSSATTEQPAGSRNQPAVASRTNPAVTERTTPTVNSRPVRSGERTDVPAERPSRRRGRRGRSAAAGTVNRGAGVVSGTSVAGRAASISSAPRNGSGADSSRRRARPSRPVAR